jgi:hypothetical protein
MPLTKWRWRISVSRAIRDHVEQWFHIQNKLPLPGHAFKSTFVAVSSRNLSQTPSRTGYCITHLNKEFAHYLEGYYWQKKNSTYKDWNVFHARMMRWSRHVERMSAMRNSYKDLVGHPQEKRQFGKPRYRWENNNKADPKCKVSSVDWIQIKEGWNGRTRSTNYGDKKSIQYFNPELQGEKAFWKH